MDGNRITLIAGTGLLLFLLFINGCGGADDRNVDDVIRQRAKDRIAALAGKIRGDCRTAILGVATRRADSLLIDRARKLERLDGRPPKPRRPGAPAVRELTAPLPLRPLFPFEIRYDTLLRDSLLLDSLRTDSIDRGLLEVIDSTLIELR